MRLWQTLLCGCWLPFLALADPTQGIELRIAANDFFPGDVIEIEAEMRRSDFAEFQLHVPAHPQLHFVAQSPEPLRYFDGEYVQRSLLLLQPMMAGDFELSGITASVQQGEVVTEVALRGLNFSVNSYAAVDESKELAPLVGSTSTALPTSNSYGLFILLVGVVVLVVWLSLRKSHSQSEVVIAPVETIEDLAATLERGEASVDLIERLLARSDLVIPSTLRDILEAAAYANRLDAKQLLGLIREEAAR
jgi:hypothetical protein